LLAGRTLSLVTSPTRSPASTVVFCHPGVVGVLGVVGVVEARAPRSCGELDTGAPTASLLACRCRDGAAGTV